MNGERIKGISAINMTIYIYVKRYIYLNSIKYKAQDDGERIGHAIIKQIRLKIVLFFESISLRCAFAG